MEELENAVETSGHLWPPGVAPRIGLFTTMFEICDTVIYSSKAYGIEPDLSSPFPGKPADEDLGCAWPFAKKSP